MVEEDTDEKDIGDEDIDDDADETMGEHYGGEGDD